LRKISDEYFFSSAQLTINFLIVHRVQYQNIQKVIVDQLTRNWDQVEYLEADFVHHLKLVMNRTSRVEVKMSDLTK
jgi:hypothetical protein